MVVLVTNNCLKESSVEIRVGKFTLVKVIVTKQNTISFDFPSKKRIKLYASCGSCENKILMKRDNAMSLIFKKSYVYNINEEYCCNKCKLTSQLIR